MDILLGLDDVLFELNIMFALATIIKKFESTNHINYNKFVPMFELTQYLCSLYTTNDCQSCQDKSAIYWQKQLPLTKQHSTQSCDE